MRVLTVKYNELHDEVKIKFSNEINQADWVTKADVLLDLISMLKNEYETLLSVGKYEFSDEWELGNMDNFENVYKRVVEDRNHYADILNKVKSYEELLKVKREVL